LRCSRVCCFSKLWLRTRPNRETDLYRERVQRCLQAASRLETHGLYAVLNNEER